MSSVKVTYQEAQNLLANPEFLENCADNDVDPREYLGFDSYTRSDKCARPIVVERVNLETGELSSLLLPCGSANADLCPECAEFSQRLRTRQILDTLEAPSMRVALFTLTAPSFGKVHRAYWTAKDDFRYRHLSEAQRDAKRLLKKRQSKSCPCGEYHTHDDSRIGTPIDAARYRYAEEVVWSKNLPALMKSAVRSLRRVADDCGIDRSSLRLYSPYERQKRGSLHAHVLIAVEGNAAGFARLVARLKTSWQSPTARIPDELVEHYGSPVVFGRMLDADLLGKSGDLPDFLPRATWKGAKKTPATEFGSEYDIRILEADKDNQELSTTVDTYKQAASYVAKYLTKNQSAFSPFALKRYSNAQKNHFYKLRRTAIALLADRVFYEVKESTLLRERAVLSDTPSVRIKLINDELHRIRARGVVRSPLVDLLIDDLEGRTLTRGSVRDAVELLEHEASSLSTRDVRDAVLKELLLDIRASFSFRSLKMKLNKVADNGGFTGALALVSNWRKSITVLKEEMRSYVRNLMDTPPPEFTYLGVNVSASQVELLARQRYSPPPWLTNIMDDLDGYLEGIKPNRLFTPDAILTR